MVRKNVFKGIKGELIIIPCENLPEHVANSGESGHGSINFEKYSMLICTRQRPQTLWVFLAVYSCSGKSRPFLVGICFARNHNVRYNIGFSVALMPVDWLTKVDEPDVDSNRRLPPAVAPGKPTARHTVRSLILSQCQTTISNALCACSILRAWPYSPWVKINTLARMPLHANTKKKKK